MASVVPPTSTSISSPSDSLIITSPTPSASSLSSSGFDFVSVKPKSSDSGNAGTNAAGTPVRPKPERSKPQPGEESSFSDDDEIVWGVSEGEDLEGSTSGLKDVLSDDDFVVLSRTRSPMLSSRSRAKTSESTTSQASTVRGVPHSGILEPHPSVNFPQGADTAAKLTTDTEEVVTSELANELAKLSVEDKPLVGEASGTRTPVREADLNIPGAFPKKKGKKKKKERTPEEEALRKQRRKEKKERKERERREKEAAKLLKKNMRPVAPELSKSASTATLVPSSSINVNYIAPLEEATPVPAVVPLPSPPPVNAPKKKKKSKKVKAAEAPPSRNDTVKVSEQSDISAPTPYDEAVGYITSYISNASARNDPICHLTLLQSLIIELGLIKDVSLLPRSIKAAKKFIKLRVFLNVKEYLKKRHEGPQTVRGLMFPNRSALVKDMRQKKNYASLQWIKKRGLQDLLVGVFRH